MPLFQLRFGCAAIRGRVELGCARGEYNSLAKTQPGRTTLLADASTPSPGPRRLVKAPDACHPLPVGEGWVLTTCPRSHPARVPMKCIGNAVHPLPVGEGWVSTPAPCALSRIHYIFQGLRLCLQTGGSRVISRGFATALAPAVFRWAEATAGAHASLGSAVVRQLPGVRLRAGWALRGRISYDRS